MLSSSHLPLGRVLCMALLGGFHLYSYVKFQTHCKSVFILCRKRQEVSSFSFSHCLKGWNLVWHQFISGYTWQAEGMCLWQHYLTVDNVNLTLIQGAFFRSFIERRLQTERNVKTPMLPSHTGIKYRLPSVTCLEGWVPHCPKAIVQLQRGKVHHFLNVGCLKWCSRL